jgi:hypothetical protein
VTFWQWANEHEVIFLFALWLCTSLVFKSWNRFLRSRNIRAQGWPKPPLDGDGDIITEDRS